MTIANPESQPERSIHWTMWYGLILLTMINVFAQMDRVALAVLLQPIKAELLPVSYTHLTLPTKRIV